MICSYMSIASIGVVKGERLLLKINLNGDLSWHHINWFCPILTSTVPVVPAVTVGGIESGVTVKGLCSRENLKKAKAYIGRETWF